MFLEKDARELIIIIKFKSGDPFVQPTLLLQEKTTIYISFKRLIEISNKNFTYDNSNKVDNKFMDFIL